MTCNLEKMSIFDLLWVHKTRNHPDILIWSDVTNEVITFWQHFLWYMLAREVDKYVFFFNGNRTGVVTFNHSTKYWSFYLSPDAPRRQGLGTIMLRMALVSLQGKSVKKVLAKVIEDNFASLLLHTHLGFAAMTKKGHFCEFEKTLQR